MERILCDTSVWINHFKNSDEVLNGLIGRYLHNKIHLLSHSMIIGEIVLGGVPSDSEHVSILKRLLKAEQVTSSEFEVFVYENKLVGKGIGFVDANILASCFITKARLLTYDKRLEIQANRLGVAYREVR